MTHKDQIPQIINNIRQKAEYDVEEFVLDFLNIWGEIHKKAADYSLEHSLDCAKSIFKDYTLPFFNKYKDTGYLEYYESWVKTYSSVTLKFGNRGSMNFPLQLITYEISYHKRNLFGDFLRGILSKEINGSIESLLEFLFPILTNYTVPLDGLDILLLKVYQVLERDASSFFQQPTQQDFATNLDVSIRTVIRRMNVIRLLQMVSPVHFVDMGALGYETLFFVHSNEFPAEYQKYLLLSSDLTIGKFSVVQIPYKNSKELLDLQNNLDILVSSQLKTRSSSWNLNGLVSGEDPWIKPPMFMHGDVSTRIITPSPWVHFNLEPSFEPFRSLTAADIKIIDFFSTKGSFRSIKQFSKAINVSPNEISKRLQEYADRRIITKATQFYNIGLDLSIFFFISSDEEDIPWIQHLLTFPKVDVFYQKKESPNYYFGYLKLPNKWIKPFARKVDLVKKEYDVKFYYKIASAVDHFKWGVSLKETYV